MQLNKKTKHHSFLLLKTLPVWKLCAQGWLADSTLLRRSFVTTYPGHRARQNRCIAICTQYDGGLAHGGPVTGGVVMLRRDPYSTLIVRHEVRRGFTGRTIHFTGGILARGRINGSKRGSRCCVFKRPVCFIGFHFARFIFRGTKSFPFVYRRRLGHRVAVLRFVISCSSNRSPRRLGRNTVWRLPQHFPVFGKILQR